MVDLLIELVRQRSVRAIVVNSLPALSGPRPSLVRLLTALPVVIGPLTPM